MKFVYRTLIGLVLFVAISLIGAHFYFSPKRLHALIQPRLQNTLQRTVSFQNAQLHYGLEPSIRLSHLVIQNRTGVSQHPFIQAEHAQMALSPIAFLTGQYRMGTLQLGNSHISITVNHKGEHNIDDLMQTKQMRAPINQLQLTHTTLSYHNQHTARKTTVQIKSATLLAIQNQDHIGFTGDIATQNLIIQTQTDTTHLPGLNLALQSAYNPKTKNITLNELAIKLGPLLANLSGHINWQTLTTNLHTQDSPLDFERIKTYLVEQNLLSPQATLSGTGTLDVHISGLWPPKVKGQLKVINLALTDPNHFKNPIINGELDLTADAQNLRLHALKFQSGLTDITLSGVMSNLYQRPHLSFAWVSHTADIDGFLPPPKSTHAQWGFASPAYAAAGTKKSALISLLNRLDMDGSVRADSLRYHNTWIRNFNATTRAQNGRLNIKPITGQTHGGALNARLLLTPYEQGAHLESSLSLINANANPLLNQTLGWHIPLYGALTLTAHLTGALDTTLTYLPTTTKTNGRLHMQAGKLVKWDVLQNKLKAVEQLGLLTADEVPIQNATVIFNIAGNTLALNGTQFTAANIPSRINGTSELGGVLAYTLDVDVPPSSIQFGGFNLGALLGRRTIPFRIHIGGTSQAPKITAGMR